MEDIAKAIERLSEKTWVDYLLIIVPIVISIVAIGISIHISNRQNRIAVFQLRYKAMCRLNSILMFENNVLKYNDPSKILKGFDMFLNADIFKRQGTTECDWDRTIQLTHFLSIVDNDLAILSCSLTKKQKKSLDNMMTLLAGITVDALNGKISNDEINALHNECKTFSPKVWKKLERKLKI